MNTKRTRRGRPPRKTSERADQVIRACVTRAEREAIEKKATKAALTVSAWARVRLTGSD